MAKSSLLKILRRAYKIARMSKQTGIPADELLEMAERGRARQFRIRRRQLLQGGLALTAAMAATAFPREGQRARAQTSPVLIVGAGVAGLTAAYRLTQAGVPVNIVEARNRIGGRVITLRKAAGTNLSADLGGEYLDSDHACIRSLAEEVGLTEIDLFANQEGLVETAYFFQGRFVPEAELIGDVAPVAERIEADLEAIDEFEDYTTPIPAAVALDNLSIAQYLDQIETSPLMRQIIRIAYAVFYGRDAEEQSSLNLIYVLGTELDAFAPFGASDERYVIDGGSDEIVNRLAQLVPTIETGTVLEAINSLPDGRYGVSLRSGQSSFDRTYEKILVTMPFSVLREVQLNVELPPAKALSINSLGYGTNSKLITAYTDKIWRNFGLSSDVYSDLGFHNIEESGQSQKNPGTGTALLTNYTGGTQGVAIGSGTAEIHAQQQLSQYERVYPGISNLAIPGRAVRGYWPGDLYSRGSYMSYFPGQWTQTYGAEGERVGNIFFAGEHTSFEYQGYMEGACETGELAATEILEDMGLTASARALRVKRSLDNEARGGRRRRPPARFIRRKRGLY